MDIEVIGHCSNCGKGFRMSDEKGENEYKEHKKTCTKGVMIVVNGIEYAATQKEIARLKAERPTIWYAAKEHVMVTGGLGYVEKYQTFEDWERAQNEASEKKS